MQFEIEEDLLKAINNINFGFIDIKTPILKKYNKNIKLDKNSIYIGKIRTHINDLIYSEWSYPYKKYNLIYLEKYKNNIVNNHYDNLINLSDKILYCDCNDLSSCHGNLLIMIFNKNFKN